MNENNTFNLLVDTFSNIPIGTFVIGLISIPTLIIEYVKMAKGTSCKWLINRVERAKKDGRVIEAKFDHKRAYLPKKDGSRNYTYVYTYEVDGKTIKKILLSDRANDEKSILRLYYTKNPKRAKTYGEFTFWWLRSIWPWIVAILYCIPVIVIFKLLGIPVE